MGRPAERISELRKKINSLALGGKEPLLVAVTKGRTPEEILPYYEAGLREFGENRVQEALPKLGALPKDIRWHFIGRLQGNKVKDAVGRFWLIHSIDSVKLLGAVNTRAGELGIIQEILLQVNVSGEKTKAGFRSGEVGGVVGSSGSFPNVRVLGLMTIAPAGAGEPELHFIFSSLRSLAEKLGLSELSMGMSDDFETAVSEGATIVRIGRALFGRQMLAQSL